MIEVTPVAAAANAGKWSPGSLVRARGREWIVLAGSDREVLRVRPVTGSEEDQTLIHLGLETEPVVDATFPPPDPAQRAGQDAALLLRDALILSLRRGAGPFRSFGQIGVDPRAYQLVPLMMALKLDPVRLLIADDVGVGKTIEAALIVRELIDRGDVSRFTVLCPPHLVDQWVTELEGRFHLNPAAVTAKNAARLERDLPPSESVFTTYPHSVVSLDYIKSERRRADFQRACPELVIVDEAHSCAATGTGRQQRYELLKGLMESSPPRHLVMLTATPHSGDEEAFYRLLGLLNPEFQKLGELTGAERDKLRERLSLHFVQRRRPDIVEWGEDNPFPKRETTELTYKLNGAWEKFFDSVLDYCVSVVEAAGDDVRRQRLNFWGTLALMRCVASSPAAAVQALRTRSGTQDDASDEELESNIFDGFSDALPDDDVEPASAGDGALLNALIAQAEDLAGQAGDPKLKLLIGHLSELITNGFSPVVFCRYIATAHYLRNHLVSKLKGVTVGVVTGEIPSEERREAVDELGTADKRLLIATDCLSEGINLQDHFDAVIHYDLSWNPTRHEQREGRVDRFGQKQPIVRATLIYGSNNPVDGAVLEVILRKAEKIRKELGVPVPLPDDGHKLSQALMRAVLLRKGDRSSKRQGTFAFVEEFEEAQALEAKWNNAAEKAKKNRTVFRQGSLKPEDVLPEWKKSVAALGDRRDVERFTGRALARLGGALEPLKRGFKVPLAALPEDVRERLDAESLSDAIRIDFSFPPAPHCRSVHRSHPLVSILAETLLERTLGLIAQQDANDPGVLGRVGCWIVSGIVSRTVVVLLRLRHQLSAQRSGTPLLVEEAAAIAWSGSDAVIEETAAMELLARVPIGDPPPHVRERAVTQALELLEARGYDLEAFAQKRAQTLLADHRRMREAADARGTYHVKALLPIDIIGVFVLLPQVD